MRSNPKMPGSIPSTAELVALRSLNRSVDSRWVDWAVFLLMEGQDTPHLRILAGEVPPFNQFEMRKLVDNLFRELGLVTFSEERDAARSYAKELVKKLLEPEAEIECIMRELMHLFIEFFGFEQNGIYDFWLLAQAREDLMEYGVQYYWQGAALDNIDEIICESAGNWLGRESQD